MLIAAIVLFLGTSSGPEIPSGATISASRPTEWGALLTIARRESGRPIAPRRDGFDPIADDDSDDDERLADAWWDAPIAGLGHPSSPPTEPGRSPRLGSRGTSGRSPILRC